MRCLSFRVVSFLCPNLVFFRWKFLFLCLCLGCFPCGLCLVGQGFYQWIPVAKKKLYAYWYHASYKTLKKKFLWIFVYNKNFEHRCLPYLATFNPRSVAVQIKFWWNWKRIIPKLKWQKLESQSNWRRRKKINKAM